MWVAGQFHDPAALALKKEAPSTTEHEAGWAPKTIGCIGKNIKFLAPAVKPMSFTCRLLYTRECSSV